MYARNDVMTLFLSRATGPRNRYPGRGNGGLGSVLPTATATHVLSFALTLHHEVNIVRTAGLC